MLAHSFVPRQFQLGIVVPIVKDHQGKLGDQNNYRGITSSSRHGSNVYRSFRDASKAFDRVVHSVLYLKLLRLFHAKFSGVTASATGLTLMQVFVRSVICPLIFTAYTSVTS